MIWDLLLITIQKILINFSLTAKLVPSESKSTAEEWNWGIFLTIETIISILRKVCVRATKKWYSLLDTGSHEPTLKKGRLPLTYSSSNWPCVRLGYLQLTDRSVVTDVMFVYPLKDGRILLIYWAIIIWKFTMLKQFWTYLSSLWELNIYIVLLRTLIKLLTCKLHCYQKWQLLISLNL